MSKTALKLNRWPKNRQQMNHNKKMDSSCWMRLRYRWVTPEVPRWHLSLDVGFTAYLSWRIIFTHLSCQAPVLGDLVPSFPQPANTEDAIIEVLKYSQKDMDAAIARVQAEVCPDLVILFSQIHPNSPFSMIRFSQHDVVYQRYLIHYTRANIYKRRGNV